MNKKQGGRPSKDTYQKAKIPLNFSQRQIDALERLGYSKYESGVLVRSLLDDFVIANGGFINDSK